MTIKNVMLGQCQLTQNFKLPKMICFVDDHIEMQIIIQGTPRE